MKCYARWCEEEGKQFRDETILQFGESWQLIANLILLNPGSAMPKNREIQNDFLFEKNLPYLAKPKDDRNYYECTIDPLMRNVIKCFGKVYDGGVIKIYNLFNLRNAVSKNALKMLENTTSSCLFTEDISFLSAPVIFATGKKNSQKSKKQLEKFYEKASSNEKLYLAKTGEKKFGLKKVVSIEDIFQSYHPSYAFNYGNEVDCNSFEI